MRLEWQSLVSEPESWAPRAVGEGGQCWGEERGQRQGSALGGGKVSMGQGDPPIWTSLTYRWTTLGGGLGGLCPPGVAC